MSDSDPVLLEALLRLERELHKRILGRPAHPWVPGVEFADGVLLNALVNARCVLLDHGVHPDSD